MFRDTAISTIGINLNIAGDWLSLDGGMAVALVIAGIMNFTGYFFSDKIALASYGAQPLTHEEVLRELGFTGLDLR